MTDLVSIIVPAYNHEDFVAGALISALDQSYSPIEVVIVDDGSKDSTAGKVAEIIRLYPARTRLIVQENAGAHAAINRGLREARGEWLTVLNSDDLYDVSRIEKLVKACQNRGCNWAFSGVSMIDDRGRSVLQGQQLSFIRQIQESINDWPSVGFSLLKSNVTISSGNLFFRRSVYEKAGEFKPLQYVHDWDYALRLLLQDEPVFINEALYQYRLHSNNSFHTLNDVAGRETSYVMRKFLLAACAGEPTNDRVPNSINWPGFFEAIVERLNYAIYLPSKQEKRFPDPLTPQSPAGG